MYVTLLLLYRRYRHIHSVQTQSASLSVSVALAMAWYISIWNVVEYTFTCTIPCREGMGLTVNFVYCSMSIQFLLLWPSYHSSASPFSLSLPPNLLSFLTPLTLLSPSLLPPQTLDMNLAQEKVAPILCKLFC